MGLYLTLRTTAGEHLGVVEILNMDGGIKSASYKATLFRRDENRDSWEPEREPRVGPIWFVHDFPRGEGAWLLVQAVIDRMPQEFDREPMGPVMLNAEQPTADNADREPMGPRPPLGIKGIDPTYG